jgi:hypothetical protein
VQSLHAETIHLGLDVHKHSICVGQVVKATRTGLAGASVHHGEAVASRIVAVTASGSDTLSACDAPASSRLAFAPARPAMNRCRRRG